MYDHNFKKIILLAIAKFRKGSTKKLKFNLD